MQAHANKNDRQKYSFLLNLIFIHQEFGFSTLNLPCSFINAKHSGRQHLTDQTGIIALPYSTVNVRLGYRFHYYGNHCNPIDVTINKNLFAKTAAFRCPGFSFSIVYLFSSFVDGKAAIYLNTLRTGIQKQSDLHLEVFDLCLIIYKLMNIFISPLAEAFVIVLHLTPTIRQIFHQSCSIFFIKCQ